MFDNRTPAADTIKRGVIDFLSDQYPELVFTGGVGKPDEISLADPRVVRKGAGETNTKINATITGYKKNVWYFYDRHKLEDWVNEFNVRTFALRDYSYNELRYVLKMLKIPEAQVDVYRANKYQGQARIRITAKKASLQFIGTVLVDVVVSNRC